MHTFFRTLLVGTVLAFGASTVASAAGAQDPVVGTWKLDLAKSRFSPGPALKSQTRTYAATADGVALTFTGVAADGTAMSGASNFEYDGKNVFAADWGGGVSKDPYVKFAFKGGKKGDDLKVVWVDNKGATDTTTAKIQ